MINLGGSVLVQLWSGGDYSNDLRDVGLSSVGLGQSQHLDHSVNVPLLVGGELLANLAYLVRQLGLELWIRCDEVVDELLDDGLDVRGIGDLVNQVESLLLKLHIVILQAISDGTLVSLDGVEVDVDHLLQLKQGHVPDIVLLVGQESAEDVDSHDS